MGHMAMQMISFFYHLPENLSKSCWKFAKTFRKNIPCSLALILCLVNQRQNVFILQQRKNSATSETQWVDKASHLQSLEANAPAKPEVPAWRSRSLRPHEAGASGLMQLKPELPASEAGASYFEAGSSGFSCMRPEAQASPEILLPPTALSNCVTIK